jgi:hypothetical protein
MKDSQSAPVDAVVLLPCPFCGAEAESYYFDYVENGTEAVVGCLACSAEIRERGPNDGQCQAAWNTRQPSVAIIPAAKGDAIAGGWKVDPKLLGSISKETDSVDGYASMETVESIILVLADRGIVKIGQ